MNILVEATYLAHESGTKFYEAISFWNQENKHGLLVKRWGKMTQANGKGEFKLEPFADVRQLQDGYSKIVSDKFPRGYSKARPDFDYFNGSSVCTQKQEFVATTANHFANSGDIEFTIFKALGLKDIENTDRNDSEVIIEEPKPEPVRDANWGSW